MKKLSPTPAETNVLQILWDRDHATAPDIHTEICKTAEVGYTTVLKRIQRMEEKGFVERAAKKGRAHTYKAVRKPSVTRQGLVSRLIHNAFDNSPNALIQHAIREHELSSDDIAALRNLLDEVEKAQPK